MEGWADGGGGLSAVDASAPSFVGGAPPSAKSSEERNKHNPVKGAAERATVEQQR